MGDVYLDWDEAFNRNTSTREQTCEFADGDISGKEWINVMWPIPSKHAARGLIKMFGVEGARRRAKRWTKNM